MEGRMLERDMIFYSPGTRGATFTYTANHYITPQMVQQTIEYLESETERSISSVEERRAAPRLSIED